jgi:hypothetical protein
VPPTPQAMHASSSEQPLVLAKRGVFFVNYRHGPLFPSGTVTVDQMYVEYEIPAARAPGPPLVLLPGGCHTSAAYDETPDGREGWRSYFLRRGYALYLAEWAGRGPSGFNPSPIHQAAASGSASSLPHLLFLSHASVWTMFRFGPSFGVPHPGLQFPIEAVEHYYAQLIPNTESLLDRPDLATADALIALLERIGRAVVVGHSRASDAILPALIRRPELFAGFVALEPVGCRERYREEDTAALAKVPLLTLFGDYLEGTMWLEFAEEWRELSERLGAAGGDARHVALAGSGIRGNSHMLMMDRNSGEIADLILEWVRARA